MTKLNRQTLSLLCMTGLLLMGMGTLESTPAFAENVVTPAPECTTLDAAATQATRWDAPKGVGLGTAENPGINYKPEWYMPLLDWDTLLVAPVRGGDCAAATPVNVNTVRAAGAGKGVIVSEGALDFCKMRGKKTCVVLFNGKSYNLKSRQVVDRLRCSNLPYSPRESAVPFALWNQVGRYWRDYGGERTYAYDRDRTYAFGNRGYGDYLCFPVPKKSGTYRMTVIGSDRPERFPGQGWVTSCRSESGGYIRCNSYYDGPETLDWSGQDSMIVNVGKNSVETRGGLFW